MNTPKTAASLSKTTLRMEASLPHEDSQYGSILMHVDTQDSSTSMCSLMGSHAELRAAC
jgi:hypothetical protein